MADVAILLIQGEGLFCFFVIKGFVLPFNGRYLFDSFFSEREPAVDTIQDYGRYGCFIARSVVKDPLDLDWRKLSANRKGFNICADGLLAFSSSWVDELVPG